MRSVLSRIFSSVVVVAFAALPLACTPGGGGAGEEAAPSENGTAEAPLGKAPGGAALCGELATLPKIDGNLSGWLASAPVASPGSEGFKEPTAANLTAFQSAVEQLVEEGPTQQVVSQLDGLGYSVLHYRHESGDPFLVLEEKAPRSGGGTFVINPAPARDLWLEVPHANFDAGTLEQGATQLVKLGARALLITGTHRCANAQATPCEGQSSVCGGALRISDSAHYENTYFMAAHKALRAAWPNAVAVSLHGMDTAGHEAALISDGTTLKQPNAISIRLRDAINARLGAGSPLAYSCNDAADDGKFRPLCGTSNVQGRFDNGSANACGASAASSQGRFVHLEQDAPLRKAGNDVTEQALAETSPCTLGGNGAGCPAVAPLCQ